MAIITAWPVVLTSAGEGHLGFGRSASTEVKKVRRVLTIEVDIKRRAVVQARGWGNRVASGKPLRVLQDWTARERLRLAI